MAILAAAHDGPAALVEGLVLCFLGGIPFS
jgi:hypothetical protein